MRSWLPNLKLEQKKKPFSFTTLTMIVPDALAAVETDPRLTAGAGRRRRRRTAVQRDRNGVVIGLEPTATSLRATVPIQQRSRGGEIHI